MDLVDKKIGTVGEVAVTAANLGLTVGAKLSNPISVGGLVLGSVAADVTVTLDEAAVIAALEAKYTNSIVKAALEMLKEAITIAEKD